MLLTLVLTADSSVTAALASTVGEAVTCVHADTGAHPRRPREVLNSVNKEPTTHECILGIPCSATRSGKSLPGRL